jgi:Domain of unknown function (DUF4394)
MIRAKQWVTMALTAMLATAGCDNEAIQEAIREWHKGKGQDAGTARPDPGPMLVALTSENKLITFSVNRPGQPSAAVPISNLVVNESVVGITIRPTTGELFGLGDSSRLYRIDRATGVATMVGTGPFSPMLYGSNFGVDFNPTVDRIRVVSDAKQNLRLHPDLGTVIDFDPMTAGVQPDADLNPPTPVAAAAYTNSLAGATTTTLFTLDFGADALLRQGGPDSMPPSPNTGVLTSIGPLGVDTGAPLGFDIAPVTNTAYAALHVKGVSELHTIDLATGAATRQGAIPASVRAIAVLP